MRSATAVELETLQALPDEEVVRRVLGGEIELFEILMRRYNQRLYRVGRAILRDDAEAELVMQDAYIAAYTHLGQFAGRASFATWLTRIAVNEARARLRSRRRTVDLASVSERQGQEILASPERSPEQQALDDELRRLLEASIEGLPEAYRSVFVLRHVEGLDTAETAECLDMSEAVVKTRLHRARTMLREDLFRRAGGATADAFRFHLSRCDYVVAAVFLRLSRLG